MELGRRSSVNSKTIADFERGVRNPLPRTLRDVVQAFCEAGISFLPAEEGVGGQGVRLKWGVEPAVRQGGEEEEERRRRRAGATPKDAAMQDLFDYWRQHPDEWRHLSEPLRRAVLREIHGCDPEVDTITDNNPHAAM